jgi:threonyl-tRNA synthetase
MVRKVLIESKIPFVEVADEAAFYGPKIDVQIYSVIGREFTLATNQVDFSQGRSFKLQYTTPENSTETPLIIHRAPLGTHERFIGFLLEHYAGRFPTWLSPVQVKILPISDKFLPYAKEVYTQLKKAGIRVETDERSEKVGKKIRDAELSKVPYMLVIGERETTERNLAVRKHNKTEPEPQNIEDFINLLKEEITERK